jgi:hypothetical protein
MTFKATSAFASSLDRRFANLIPDLPFPDRLRIPEVATLLDPSPKRPFTFTKFFSVFSDFYVAVRHELPYDHRDDPKFANVTNLSDAYKVLEDNNLPVVPDRSEIRQCDEFDGCL